MSLLTTNASQQRLTISSDSPTCLVDTLQLTVGLRLEVDDIEALTPGPIVMSQHASMPDAFIPTWLLGQAGMRPRHVMKADLQLDPCLDIVGKRLPNHFVDRDPKTARAS